MAGYYQRSLRDLNPALASNLDRGSLLAAFRLNFDVDVHQGDCGGSDAGNARGVAQGAGTDLDQYFLHLAGKAADRTVVKPLRDGVLLSLFQALYGALLLQKIAFVFDFGFDGLEVVAD